MLLQAVNVSRSFGSEEIIRPTSLEVTSGRSLAITGASGSGKSTLISLLGLLLEPSAGQILLEGRNTAEMSDDQRSLLRNRSFGFVFQNPQLIGSLSVLQNVLVPACLAGRRGLEPEARQLLGMLGLSHRLEHLPYQLSTGQKRRVAVARALLLDPAIVFADEPTNDLDVERGEQVGELLFRQSGRGRALVLITHDPRLAARADQVLNLTQAAGSSP